jgi:hypothetical protein
LETVSGNARQRFNGFYGLQQSFSLPHDLCHLKGRYGGFEGDRDAARELLIVSCP